MFSGFTCLPTELKKCRGIFFSKAGGVSSLVLQIPKVLVKKGNAKFLWKWVVYNLRANGRCLKRNIPINFMLYVKIL